MNTTIERGGSLRGLRGNDDPYSVEVRKKLKGVKSEKKRIAAIMRHIVSGKTTKYKPEIMALAKNPDSSAVEIYNWISQLAETELTKRERFELTNTLIKAHSTIHGRAILAQQINFQQFQQGDAANGILKTVFGSDEELEQQILQKIQDRKEGKIREESILDKTFGAEVVYKERIKKKEIT